jgi:predicted 3-demethylubiquinone-9 3-methyltransferase (glyoxalase superfamily)
MPQKITPMLWFDREAQEAAEFYVSVFPDSKVTGIQRQGEAGPGEPGAVMVVAFELAGQEFTALNGGPLFTFNESISFVIACGPQEVVDYYWDTQTDGGEPSLCGWLKDRFGVSWQVVPRRLFELMRDPDAARANRVMQAMLQMRKIDIAELERAYAGDAAMA